MVHFSTINHLSINQPHTWAKKVFLTLDIDWAIDPVIDFTLNLLEKHQCQATIFVTHDSPSVRALMKNPLFEVGIHPNFNDLVNGKKHGTALDQINDLLSITGAVKSARSHSLFQSSRILDHFHDVGIQYDCNLYLPSEAHLDLKPWRHWNGMIRVPHFFEDDVNFIHSDFIVPSTLMSATCLKVFDFHPIHIFLNTTSVAHYKKSAPYFFDYKGLLSMVNNESTGVRDLFIDFISQNGQPSMQKVS